MKSLLRGAMMLAVLTVAGARAQTAPATPADAAPVATEQHPITEAQVRTYFEESMLLGTIQAHMQKQLDEARKVKLAWFPAPVWTMVKQNLANVDLVKVILPVYQRYYTEDDGNVIALMYEGPTGHAYAAAALQATVEAAQGVETAVVNAGALGRKRQAELTPEQIAALRQMQRRTELTTLDGLRVDEEQNALLEKTMNDVLRVTVAAHRKELATAQAAYYAKH